MVPSSKGRMEDFQSSGLTYKKVNDTIRRWKQNTRNVMSVKKKKLLMTFLSHQKDPMACKLFAKNVVRNSNSSG